MELRNGPPFFVETKEEQMSFLKPSFVMFLVDRRHAVLLSIWINLVFH